MSVYLKCKAAGKKFSIEGKTTAEKPYLAVNYTTQTGANSSQTTMSKAYYPLTTNTEFVDSANKVAIKASNTKYYIANNTNTTTTTVESTETKYTGIAYIPMGDPIFTTNNAQFLIGTSTNCGGVSANWATTRYERAAVAVTGMDVRNSIGSAVSDYFSNSDNHSITLFKGNISSSTVSTTGTVVRAYTSSTKLPPTLTDYNVTIIIANNNAYLRHLANNGKYLGIFSQTRYSKSGSASGYNNTSARKFPYNQTYWTYQHNVSIYSSYDTIESSGTSYNYSCSEYVEDVVTKTVTVFIT